MAATLVELQARREALLKAIQSGALIVKHGDTSITYRSMKEMLEALALLDGLIAGFDGTTRVRTFVVHPRSGY